VEGEEDGDTGRVCVLFLDGVKSTGLGDFIYKDKCMLILMNLLCVSSPTARAEAKQKCEKK
jgi:hypothetical protein